MQKLSARTFGQIFIDEHFKVIKKSKFSLNSFALLKLQKLLSRTFVQIVAQFKFLKMGQWRFFLKTICTSQFEKFGQELLFKLLVINIQELQMSPIIQFCSNDWWCKRQVAMIILNKKIWSCFGWNVFEISEKLADLSSSEKNAVKQRKAEKMNLIAFAQIFAQIR